MTDMSIVKEASERPLSTYQSLEWQCHFGKFISPQAQEAFVNYTNKKNGKPPRPLLSVLSGILTQFNEKLASLEKEMENGEVQASQVEMLGRRELESTSNGKRKRLEDRVTIPDEYLGL